MATQVLPQYSNITREARRKVLLDILSDKHTEDLSCLLVEELRNLGHIGKKENYLLKYAINLDDARMLRILIKTNLIEYELIDEAPFEPLHYAICSNSLKAAIELMNHPKFDVELHYSKRLIGYVIGISAGQAEKIEFIKLLMEKHVKLTYESLIMAKNQLHVFKFLYSRINMESYEHTSLIMNLIHCHNAPVLAFVLEQKHCTIDLHNRSYFRDSMYEYYTRNKKSTQQAEITALLERMLKQRSQIIYEHCNLSSPLIGIVDSYG